MNTYLVGSSLLFTIPMSVAAYLHLWENWASLFLLTWTSVIYHSTKHQLFVYVDYTAVYILVAQSIRYGYQVDNVWVPLAVCGTNAILFNGGRMFNTLVYHKDPRISTLSHMLVHLLSVGGTTFLMLHSYVVDGRGFTHRLVGN